MGGNALKTHLGLDAHRMNKNEYDTVCHSVLNKIPTANVILSYRKKDSFGDVDVLVTDLPNDPFPELKQHKNGNVTSYAFPFDDKYVQVDLIRVPKEAFDFAYGYFSYNDLGAFLGVTARAVGLKLGYTGLYYELYQNGQKVIDVLVTNEFDMALSFLGFSIGCYYKGFDTMDDVYKYVASGHYFSASDFLLENRNGEARRRDSKRKNYIGFLDYIGTHQLETKVRPSLVDLVDSFFPEFGTRLCEAINYAHAMQLDLEKKRIISGKWISEMTGLTGADLERAIKWFKQKYPQSVLSEMTKEEVSALVKEYFNV